MFYMIYWSVEVEGWRARSATVESFQLYMNRLAMVNGRKYCFGLAHWKQIDYEPKQIRVPKNPGMCSLARIERVDDYVEFGQVIDVVSSD